MRTASPDGWHFECQGCGNCCLGEPGYVFVNDSECRQIARFLGSDMEELLATRLRTVAGGLSLRERGDGSCALYDNGCSVYPVRPAQCRTYPFWPSILDRERGWEQEASSCPGIGRGREYDANEIAGLIASGGRSPSSAPVEHTRGTSRGEDEGRGDR